jgi:predicted SAM-dependent methyltransferase
MRGMDRTERLLKYADRHQPGIEVAPFFNPTLRKSDGFPVLTMDVFDTETLLGNCRTDDLIPTERIGEIEEVDIVGDASSIAERVREKGHAGNVHYVISSHNFEHLPNPIRFLRGCAEILAPDGVVSMAVPDCRASFDIFRHPTRLADWLEAYHEGREMPSPATIFDTMSNIAMYQTATGVAPACALGADDPAKFVPDHGLRAAYSVYGERRSKAAPYRDAHVSVFFPQTLELMLRDLRYLGLIDLDIVEVSPTYGHEFFVHLRKPAEIKAIDDAEFYARRDALMADAWRSTGNAPYLAHEKSLRLGKRMEKMGKRVLKNFVGEERFNRLHKWHRETIRRRPSR